jgi:hypothetical protein
MIATLKASARSRGSNESLPSIAKTPQAQAMVIEEILDVEVNEQG